MRVLLAGLALAVLAGCSSLPRDSGYEVKTVEATGRQEPWQNRAINRAALARDGVAAVYIRLPASHLGKWKKEFVDTTRTYLVQAGSRKFQKPLERVVFRAVAIYGPGESQVYDAIIDSKAQAFTVLVPLIDAERLAGRPLIILSSDGRWGMTTKGELVEFEKGFAPDRLPAEFFRDHPSTVTQVIRLDPIADEHARIVLDSLTRSFPQPFWLRGKNGSYLGKEDIEIVAAEFTSVDGVADRIISCTSLKLGPGSAAAAPLIAVLYGYQAVNALSKEDCKK